MDKVIDGVNVSDCEHYRAEIKTKMPYGEYEILKDKCHYSGIEVIQNCKGNKGCIYKQLKRLERQYENVLKIAKENADSNEYCLQELEQENEKLKSDFDKCMDANKYHFDKWCKCEQCLKEIKEIAGEMLKGVSFGCLQTTPFLNEFKQIQDKINEVIGGRDELLR